MVKQNQNSIWQSIHELGNVLEIAYSVTDPKAIKKQYKRQIQQYPLYLAWFKKTNQIIQKYKKPLKILELGPGPGILANILLKNNNIQEYIAIEPEKIFREMTKEETKRKISKIIDDTAEKYSKENYFDFIIASAAYHHFEDKPKALKNIYRNLKNDGLFIAPEVFLPEYGYNNNYQPTNKTEFIESVLKYSSAQIMAMPKPTTAEVIDQIKTSFLDILRQEELKVCLSVFLKQLKISGFKNIKPQLMTGADKTIDYQTLGWYFITAKK